MGAVRSTRFTAAHHTTLMRRQLDRQTVYRTVYNTPRWRELRDDQLNRQPFCERCTHTRPAKIVHHITPIRDGGDPWDPANLESLCQKCHNDHHRPPVDPEVQRWREHIERANAG